MKKGSGIKTVGNPNLWVLISLETDGKSIRSTEALEIAGLGCVIRVGSVFGEEVTEAVCFVPGAEIGEDPQGNRELVYTKLRSFS